MAWWPAWIIDAACGGRTDVDFFDADPGPALAVCATCVVVRECGQWAADLNIRHGVFGGLTPAERRGEGRSMVDHEDLDDHEKRRRNGLARANALKELTRRHRDEFRAIYAAEKAAAGLEARVRPRRTA